MSKDNVVNIFSPQMISREMLEPIPTGGPREFITTKPGDILRMLSADGLPLVAMSQLMYIAGLSE